MLIEKIAADRFLKQMENIQYGSLEAHLPDGRSYVFSSKKMGPKGEIRIHDWQVFSNLLARGDIGFAEDYKEGLWETHNLADLLSFSLKNDEITKNFLFGKKLFQMAARFSYLMRRNSIKGSRANIHAHYDLGNEFYKLWLDPTMTYSSAIYKNPHDDLQTAQYNKYDRIIDHMGDGKSGKVLEIGCGWGGFAERASAKGDYNIKGITISEEQFDYATDRLKDKASIAFEDYRNQNGVYDHIVSIEMFEAVGEQYWQTYFAKIKNLLATKGKAVIQTITIDDNRFEDYKKSGDFIRSYIFPGGMLPSPSVLDNVIQSAGLKINDRFSFGHDYARTLQSWLNNFDDQKDAILQLGFDDKFIRLWRFYLAGCIAGFSTERTDVVQLEISHA